MMKARRVMKDYLKVKKKIIQMSNSMRLTVRIVENSTVVNWKTKTQNHKLQINSSNLNTLRQPRLTHTATFQRLPSLSKVQEKLRTNY